MKTLHIFKVQLWADGRKLKSLLVLAASSVEASQIAQTLFIGCSECTILVSHNPQAFFGCHG
jgi:hypothetical protein